MKNCNREEFRKFSTARRVVYVSSARMNASGASDSSVAAAEMRNVPARAAEL